MIDKVLKIENGDMIGACNDLLKGFLESKKVDALLVPQEVPSGKASFHVLISDPRQLHANVFAPVLPVSSAAIISKITKVRPAEKTIGVVMRPCQIRALIELVKLNQANLENIVIIGVDCPGTFSVNAYGDFPEGTDPAAMILDALGSESSDTAKLLRPACQICKDPVPTNADMVIGIFGADTNSELFIRANTDAGEALLAGCDTGGELEEQSEETGDMQRREKAVKDILEERGQNRERFIRENGEIKGIEALTNFYDKCVNCHNCMKACPICYCRECLFESSLFDAEAGRYLRKAESRGLFKMPNDSLLFHVTRMNHMILSCVGCGLCEQACPSEIPLMNLIIPVAGNAQEELGYEPGKDMEDMIPMVVYREEEYTEVGE